MTPGRVARRVLSLLGLALMACDAFGGGGGGGGGGTSPIAFAKGFTYVRKDDRNVYVADESNFQTVGVLTTGQTASTPSLSPDGKQIVFARKTAAGTELALVPSSGGTASTLLASNANVANVRTPVFSPDGTKVAFTFDSAGAAAVGVVDATGSGFAKLNSGGSLGYAFPSWYPDGSAVLAAAGGAGLGFTQVEKLDLGTGAPTNITNTLGTEAQAIVNRLVISPDGTQAVFDARVGSGVSRIFVIDLATKKVTKANDYTNDPGANDTFPGWKSSTELTFGSDSGGADNVYSVKPDGTARSLLLPNAIEAWFGPQK